MKSSVHANGRFGSEGEDIWVTEGLEESVLCGC